MRRFEAKPGLLDFGVPRPWENAFALVRTSQQAAPSLSRDWPLPVGPWQRVCLVTAETADEGRRGFFSCLSLGPIFSHIFSERWTVG